MSLSVAFGLGGIVGVLVMGSLALATSEENEHRKVLLVLCAVYWTFVFLYALVTLPG